MVWAKFSNKTADLVSHAIIKSSTQFKASVKTVTYDSGKVFCGDALIDEELKSSDYFARSFIGWERGGNENYNELIR